MTSLACNFEPSKFASAATGPKMELKCDLVYQLMNHITEPLVQQQPNRQTGLLLILQWSLYHLLVLNDFLLFVECQITWTTMNFSYRQELFKARQSACSLPPPPTTSTFWLCDRREQDA